MTLWYESCHVLLYQVRSLVVYGTRLEPLNCDMRVAMLYCTRLNWLHTSWFYITDWNHHFMTWELPWFIALGWTDQILAWHCQLGWNHITMIWKLSYVIVSDWQDLDLKLLCVHSTRLDPSQYDIWAALLHCIILKRPDFGVTWSVVYGTRVEPSHCDMRVALLCCIRSDLDV